MLETALSVLAIGLILYLGWLGIIFGVFQELSNALWLFFAMMVALRYWWLATAVLVANTPLIGANAALVAFWSVFLIACVPLLVLTHFVQKDAVAPYPHIVDSLLGPIFGVLSAAILVSCLMLSLSVIMPSIWEPYQPTGLIVPLDKLPIGVYQTVEKKWLGIAEKDPGHTRFPTLEKADVEKFEKYWR
jgi:uncharacterized membrane protein required for colicin V production